MRINEGKWSISPETRKLPIAYKDLPVLKDETKKETMFAFL